MKTTIDIRSARRPEEILLCWEAMRALRPHLVREQFVDTVTEMIGAGYHLAYIEEDGRAAAAVGYRFLHFLLHGKHIYIDDLSTLPSARRKGYGRALLDYVFAIAAERGLKVVTLDSGPQRHDAHRLYLNDGFTIASYHFVRTAD
jgi:GNAT superfamily N-acetyltransferase